VIEPQLTARCQLASSELALIRSVLERHPEITRAILFGSRAKGTAKPGSDIDLALAGAPSPLAAQAIASELEDLPLPYRFDVVSLGDLAAGPLLEHIERVGVQIYG
jgi:uncharacterized protein